MGGETSTAGTASDEDSLPTTGPLMREPPRPRDTNCERSALSRRTDVVVIGGGPAGSTVSALLAEKGWRVGLIEKTRHPRFHIGESLLPMNLPLLARLGVMQEIEKIGVVKRGAELCDDSQARPPRTFYFADAMDEAHPYAFQVLRSQFDHVLLSNAASRGVEVSQEACVTNVALDKRGAPVVHVVDARGRELEWCCRFVVDASGRDTFLSRQLGVKRKNPHHETAAVFGHFVDADRRPSRDEGNISIYWFDHGWVWMIPLSDGVMSVGAVCRPDYLRTRRTGLDEFLRRTVERCPGAHARMHRAAPLGHARAAGNYSYRSTRMFGLDYLLVGDAYAFVDPVFSSGVYLAMQAASAGADAVDAHLRGDAAAPGRFERLDRDIRRAIATLSWFIYRFNSPEIRRLFLSAPRRRWGKDVRRVSRMEAAVTSMLAGDLFRDTPIRTPLACFKLLYYVLCLHRQCRRFLGLGPDGLRGSASNEKEMPVDGSHG